MIDSDTHFFLFYCNLFLVLDALKVAIHACQGPKHTHTNGERGSGHNGHNGHHDETGTKSPKDLLKQRRLDEVSTISEPSTESQKSMGAEQGVRAVHENPVADLVIERAEVVVSEKHPNERDVEKSNENKGADKAAAEAKFEASRPVGAKWPPGGGNGNALHPVPDQEDGYWPTCDSEGCVRKMSQHAPAGSYGPGANYTIDTTQVKCCSFEAFVVLL